HGTGFPRSAPATAGSPGYRVSRSWEFPFRQGPFQAKAAILRFKTDGLQQRRSASTIGPVGTPQPIQHMWAQRMTFGQRWMLEVVPRLMLHAQRLHQAARGLVELRREGDHLGQLQPLESAGQRGVSRLLGQPLAPLIRYQSPADFHRRTERQRQLAPGQPGHADEASIVLAFQRPEAETMVGEMQA